MWLGRKGAVAAAAMCGLYPWLLARSIVRRGSRLVRKKWKLCSDRRRRRTRRETKFWEANKKFGSALHGHCT
jgi:hypothetical protein